MRVPRNNRVGSEGDVRRNRDLVGYVVEVMGQTHDHAVLDRQHDELVQLVIVGHGRHGPRLRGARELDGRDGVEVHPDDVAEWWQRYVIYRRKVGGKTVGGQVRLRRDELRWYFDAMTGGALDEQTLVDRTNERQLRSYEVRKARIGEEGEDWPGYESGRLPRDDEQ